jgi:hypothetical protein
LRYITGQFDGFFFGHSRKWRWNDAAEASQNQSFFAEKTLWTSATNRLHFPPIMKCDTKNSVLTFVLGAFVVLGVVFAVQTINRTREFRTLQVQAAVDNSNLMRLQSLGADVYAYNQKNPTPELTRILQNAR